MIEINIPGQTPIQLRHLMLDVNGTIAVDGHPIKGVKEQLDQLKSQVNLHLVTANTHGKQAELDDHFELRATIITAGQQRAQKAALVQELGAESVCFIGNGTIDTDALRQARLGIVVLEEEGVSVKALQAADILAPSITAALDLLRHPARLIATLRQ